MELGPAYVAAEPKGISGFAGGPGIVETILNDGSPSIDPEVLLRLLLPSARGTLQRFGYAWTRRHIVPRKVHPRRKRSHLPKMKRDGTLCQETQLGLREPRKNGDLR